jgi:hypothetical protein
MRAKETGHRMRYRAICSMPTESKGQTLGVESTENPLRRNGGEKLDAFIGEKSFSLEQAKDFVCPEFFGGFEVEVGHGDPLALLIPKASRSFS